MYIFNTCHPKAHLVQGYPPVVSNAECRLCGERVRLSPIEVLTNQTDLESGRYVCPLCRRLVAKADRSILDGLESGKLFPRNAVFPCSTRTMYEMEDQYDRNEEESDSDEAADDECEGSGSTCPPSDEGPDAEECGDNELPFEADLWLQVHVHLTIHRARQVK